MFQEPEYLQQQVRWPDVVFKYLAWTQHCSLQNDDHLFVDALLE
jgi:hypothetical protein